MRYYVIADPHGFYTEMKEALTQSGYFEDEQPHKLIVCGDLFDRGDEAAEMQAFIVDAIAADQAILIRGNHEDLMEQLVAEPERWLTPMVTRTHHWSNGTVDTLLQLTGMDLTEAIVRPEVAAKRMENTPFFRTILPAMKNYHETQRHIFVHGWIPAHQLSSGPWKRYMAVPEWRKMPESDWHLARWYNGMEAAESGVIEPGKTIVCGHWHCSFGHAALEGKGSEFGPDADFSPYRAEGILAIDACTAHSRMVNCVVIEDEEMD